MRAQTWLRVAVPAVLFVSGAAADIANIPASKDNTLFEDPQGILSNGAGDYFFVGLTRTDLIRRGLIQFDVAAAVPEGATITRATLRLHMSMTIVGNRAVDLVAAPEPWGEGESDAPSEEGAGTLAEPGDATWLHSFFADSQWRDGPGAGLDRAPVIASTAVGGDGFYEWSSDELTNVVQQWLDSPGANHGLGLVGDEKAAPSAKRFDSRTNPIEDRRPVLIVEFTPGKTCLPDIDGNGIVDGADFLEFLALFFAADPRVDFDGNGSIDGGDFLAFLAAFFQGC